MLPVGKMLHACNPKTAVSLLKKLSILNIRTVECYHSQKANIEILAPETGYLNSMTTSIALRTQHNPVFSADKFCYSKHIFSVSTRLAVAKVVIRSASWRNGTFALKKSNDDLVTAQLSALQDCMGDDFRFDSEAERRFHESCKTEGLNSQL